MSGLWLFACGALAFGVWWLRHRSFTRHWRHLEKIIDDLADGKKPATFVFQGSRRFTRAARSLETIAIRQARLSERIDEEKFNFEAILASMVEGVMVVGADHSIRLVNDSFRQLFDLKSSPLGGSVLGVLREASIEEIVRDTLQSGAAQTREISPIQQAQRCFAISAVPLRDSHGSIGGVVSVFHDISRLRQLEDIRREFVANVSHELRTPLSIFHGYLENLLDEPDMPRKQLAGILEILKKHSLRLNALLEDLLTLARLESRDDKLELSQIALPPFFKTLAKDWKRKLNEKKITLELNIGDDLPALIADAFRMEQVFGNLLENAIKFTPQNGTICITATADDARISIRVADTGTGIPPADLPHIFERFYRVEKARSRETGGTGLGLSIVKHIVALHGGTVEAESIFEKGTAVILHFPRQR